MTKRKIHAVNVTIYVEQTGRPALPTRQEITNGLIDALKGRKIGVGYGKDMLVQDMTIIGVYSKLSSDDDQKKGPELSALRLDTEG